MAMGLEVMAETVRLAERVARDDPADLNAELWFAVALNKQAELLKFSGRLEEAAAIQRPNHQRFLELRRREPDDSFVTRYSSEGAAQLAEIELRMAEEAARPAAERERLRASGCATISTATTLLAELIAAKKIVGKTDFAMFEAMKGLAAGCPDAALRSGTPPS
jgi:hypothetical protein